MAVGQSDESLIQGTRSGDAEAFGELTRRYVGRVYTLCLRMVGDAGAAEAMTEAVFLSAYNDAAVLAAPLESWLLQRALVQCEAPQDIAPPDADLEPDTETEEEVQAQQLQAILDQLSPSFRSAVILRDVLELDYVQVADIMNLPIGTARSRVHRARLDLSAALTARSTAGGK